MTARGYSCGLLRVAGAFLQGECAGYFTSGASSVVAAKQLHFGGQGREGLLLLLLLLLTMLLFELRQAGVQAANAHIPLSQLSLQIGLQAPRRRAQLCAFAHKILGGTDTETPGTCARAHWRLVPADSGNEGVEPLGVSFGPLAEFFLVG